MFRKSSRLVVATNSVISCWSTLSSTVLAHSTRREMNSNLEAFEVSFKTNSRNLAHVVE
jgi:hypothetical protein